MNDPRRAASTVAAALIVLLSASALQSQQAEAKRPSLSLRVTPPVGFTPLRVQVLAEVKDGSDDYADFYCAGVEWEWGDGTVSESASDCEPYEAGKSTIRRRFTADHVYRQAGQYRIIFKLKQKTRQVAATSSNVQVRSGGGDFGR
jgi:hypothetical protein